MFFISNVSSQKIIFASLLACIFQVHASSLLPASVISAWKTSVDRFTELPTSYKCAIGAGTIGFGALSVAGICAFRNRSRVHPLASCKSVESNQSRNDLIEGFFKDKRFRHVVRDRVSFAIDFKRFQDTTDIGPTEVLQWLPNNYNCWDIHSCWCRLMRKGANPFAPMLSGEGINAFVSLAGGDTASTDLIYLLTRSWKLKDGTKQRVLTDEQIKEGIKQSLAQLFAIDAFEFEYQHILAILQESIFTEHYPGLAFTTQDWIDVINYAGTDIGNGERYLGFLAFVHNRVKADAACPSAQNVGPACTSGEDMLLEEESLAGQSTPHAALHGFTVQLNEVWPDGL